MLTACKKIKLLSPLSLPEIPDIIEAIMSLKKKGKEERNNGGREEGRKKH
jgi:hypothetical protein